MLRSLFFVERKLRRALVGRYSKRTSRARDIGCIMCVFAGTACFGLGPCVTLFTEQQTIRPLFRTGVGSGLASVAGRDLARAPWH